MDALRRSRSTGRVIAAWLLLWFVVMTARGALLQPQAASGSCDAVAAHAAHHHAACGDEEEQADPHAGSHQDCPVCMHGAAPPPPAVALVGASPAPVDRTLRPRRSHVPAQAVAPPPARGPPLVS
jgi:hypothetical protein